MLYYNANKDSSPLLAATQQNQPKLAFLSLTITKFNRNNPSS